MNVKTGKEESFQLSLKKMERVLVDQPDYVINFYYFMRNSGKTNSYKTHEVYTEYVIRFLSEIKKDVCDITMDDVNRYLVWISINKDGSKKSGSYLVAVYSGLKKFFNYLKVSKRIKDNPMENIERPAPKKAEKVQRTFLSQEEVIKCMNYIREEYKYSDWLERNLALFVLLVSTGVRATACREINIENINFENNSIMVIDKGDKVFIHHLSKDKMQLIKNWLEVRERLLEGQEDKTNALFISNYKRRMSANGIDFVIKTITKVVGRSVTPHKLRGTFATACINSGATLYEVQRLMGHSSSKTTVDCYIQGQDNKLKEVGLKATDFIK